MKIKICPKCRSKDLSDGKSDFIYDVFLGIEVPIQFCNKCHEEWRVN